MKVINIAHRGARSLAPENTMAAVRRAFDEKADLWETDVRPTADGRLVLFHDEDLKRTTNVAEVFPERIEDYAGSFTFDELMQLDAGSWYGEQDPFGQIEAGFIGRDEVAAYRGEKIPTLAAGLAFTRERRWPVNLELKEQFGPLKDFPMVDRVLAGIDKSGIDTELIRISSFFHPWLDELKEKRPKIGLQALIGDDDEDVLEWRELAFDTVNAYYKLISESEIREMTGKGLTVNLFTVNKLTDMKRFIRAGATGIITDFPQVLGEYLGKR